MFSSNGICLVVATDMRGCAKAISGWKKLGTNVGCCKQTSIRFPIGMFRPFLNRQSKVGWLSTHTFCYVSENTCHLLPVFLHLIEIWKNWYPQPFVGFLNFLLINHSSPMICCRFFVKLPLAARLNRYSSAVESPMKAVGILMNSSQYLRSIIQIQGFLTEIMNWSKRS